MVTGFIILNILAFLWGSLPPQAPHKADIPSITEMAQPEFGLSRWAQPLIPGAHLSGPLLVNRAMTLEGNPLSCLGAFLLVVSK